MATIHELLTEVGFDWNSGQVLLQRESEGKAEILAHHDPILYEDVIEVLEKTFPDGSVIGFDSESICVLVYCEFGDIYDFVRIPKDIGPYLRGECDAPLF